MLSQTSWSIRGGINLQFAYLRTCHIVVVASFNLLTVFHSLRGVAVAKSTGKVFFRLPKTNFSNEGNVESIFLSMETPERGKQRVFHRDSLHFTSHGANWKQMEIDENFSPRHGSLASRAMVDVFKTFLLPKIKIRWHLRNEKRQTWALARLPTRHFYFRFQFRLRLVEFVKRLMCVWCDATNVELFSAQTIGTLGTEINKWRKNISIKLTAS